MQMTKEELLGKGIIYDLLSAISLGDFDKVNYYIAINKETLLDEFPFLKDFDEKEIKRYRENYFEIPGKHFVSPFFSTYQNNESTIPLLAKLISIYDVWSVETPIKYNVYPDHIGALLEMMSKLQFAAIGADKETLAEMEKTEKYILETFLKPTISHMTKEKTKLTNSFFLAYFAALDEWAK